MSAECAVSRVRQFPVTSRICACGCGERFEVHSNRPQQQFKYAHKPAVKRAVVAPEQGPRAQLDFRLAAKAAREELLQIAARIDAIDDALVPAWKEAHRLEAEKERLTARHAKVAELGAMLEEVIAAVDGKQETSQEPV